MIAILSFPGSNCDRDCLRALREALGAEACIVWHQERELPPDTRAIILPGGFSHGDYLRPGACARSSAIMADVQQKLALGMPALGICNGFQILIELGLLPGALMPNESLQFICREQPLCVMHTQSSPAWWSTRMQIEEVLWMPVAHRHGQFYASEQVLDELFERGQVLLRYGMGSAHGMACDNPNGSARGVAGICDRRGRVVGLMPHPERAALASGPRGEDGARFLRAWLDMVEEVS